MFCSSNAALRMIKHAVRRPLHSLSVMLRLPLPKPVTYSDHSRLLQSCKDLKSLLQIHAYILVSGLGLDDFILTQLVNLYSTFHKSDSARTIFNSVRNPSGILWNSMIRAYTKTSQHLNAIELYHEMVRRGVKPDKYTYTFLLKACTGVFDLERGISIHQEILLNGFETDVFVATALIDMYSKMGRIETAREMFERMPELDVVTWNTIIAGLSQSVDPLEAFDFFQKMQSAGVVPNSVSLLNLFPAICRISALPLCQAMHGYVVRRDFPPTVFNGLIDMYSKCGNVEVGRRIFDCMLYRDDVSWGTIISGYVHNGCFFEALELFSDVKGEDVKMNQVAAVSALSAAAEMRDLEKGSDIHTYLTQKGCNFDILVSTTLIVMYAKCGNLEKAKQLFDEILERDVVAWSAMISAFVQSEHPREALALFREMQSAGIRPNRVTIVSILPACADLSDLNLGRSIHCHVLKADLGFDISTGTALVAMYAKCWCFIYANALFDKLLHKDVVTWNAMINGFAQIGDAYNTVNMFRRLQLVGLRPDSGTMVGVLPACVLLGDLDQGMCVHGQIIKSGFESDVHVKNAVIDMYAKCGSLSSAEFLFNDILFDKDEISCNVMIAGYMQNGCAKEALFVFHRMRAENLEPNLVTIVSILPAAAYLAALREGMAFHSYAIQTGFESNVVVGNSLIDMYAKCGQLDSSKKFFDLMDGKDLVSWNAMLSGYAIHGHGEGAVSLFTKMQENHMELDSVSFISVLSACRHGGLVDEGREIFNAMSSVCHIEPDLEHYACMVDLLGRAGQLDEAWSFIQTMPLAPDAAVWGALLGACRMHSNLKLGEMALNHLVQLEPENAAHYVVLSNIYAQVGKWANVRKMRSLMNGSGLRKTPGCSWVEIKDTVHAFSVGDQSHPQFESICMVWRDWNDKMEKMGYVPDTSCVLQNVEEEEKGFFLNTHSERLAIAFAFLNIESEAIIQIVKNLRVCSDCHTVTKLVSKIINRRIIVRDASRFHHFENGACSCKDFW